MGSYSPLKASDLVIGALVIGALVIGELVISELIISQLLKTYHGGQPSSGEISLLTAQISQVTLDVLLTLEKSHKIWGQQKVASSTVRSRFFLSLLGYLCSLMSKSLGRVL